MSRLEGEKSRLEGEKAMWEGEKRRLEADKTRLEADKTRLEGEKAGLEEEKTGLEEDSLRLGEILSGLVQITGLTSGAGVGQQNSGLERCAPWSAEDFFERLHTFRPGTWPGFSDGEVLSPVECARMGWHNSSANVLTSSEGGEVTVNFEGCDGEGVLKEEGRVRELVVGKGHVLLSGWIGKCCPEKFCTLEGSERAYSEGELRSNAEEMRNVLGKIGKIGKIDEVEVEGDGATTLAVYNWTMSGEEGVNELCCGWCGRDVPIEDIDINKFDIQRTHYPFCPFRAKAAVQRNVQELGL